MSARKGRQISSKLDGVPSPTSAESGLVRRCFGRGALGFFGCDALSEVADVCTEVEVGLALLEGCPFAEHEVDGGLAMPIAGKLVLFLLAVEGKLRDFYMIVV